MRCIGTIYQENARENTASLFGKVDCLEEDLLLD